MKKILPILTLGFLFLFQSGHLFSQDLTWEQQQQLQKYFDNNSKFYGFSAPALKAVMSEHDAFFGSYADALTAVDVLNKVANAKDADVIKTLFETAGGKILEGQFPSFATWLGWMTWAKGGMDLLKSFVIDPYIMSSALEYYMSNRDLGLEPADAVVTMRSWGSVRLQLLAEFRKSYGDHAFAEISPSGMRLLPKWERKFRPYVTSHFEREAAKFKIKAKAAAELNKMNQSIIGRSEIVLEWLRQQKEKMENEEDDKAKEEAERKKREEEERKKREEAKKETEETEKLDVQIELNYPAGESPTVFTEGWIFGAKVILNPGTAEEQDISEQVRWSGSGRFTPERGSLSRPKFSTEGYNTIQLTVDLDGQQWTKEFYFQAIDPVLNGFAHIGSNAACPADAHGCPSCPHTTVGPALEGSPNVTVDGLPALRKGDRGHHAACCGPNTFEVVEGDPGVLINGRPAAKMGHATKHCGGMGKLVGGSTTPSKECGKNEKLNIAKTKCICEKGYERNDSGQCEEIVEELGENGCGKNEFWDEINSNCKCKKSFVRNSKGRCVTPEELTEELAEESTAECETTKSHLQGLLTTVKNAKSNYQDSYQYFVKYNRRFYKEVNDQAAEICENRMIAFCYRRAMSSAEAMENTENELVNLLIDVAYDLAICPELEAELNGQSTNVSSWINFQNVEEEVGAMGARLQSFGCYPADVEQLGEGVGIGENDPDFIAAGGLSTEISGDGKDNDGDGQQDEIPFASLPGYNITVAVYDSGSAKDDIFNLAITGRGILGVTPAGGLRTYGVNLPPGMYTAEISVISAPDDVGTFTINIVENGISIGSLSGNPEQGQVEILMFEVQ